MNNMIHYLRITLVIMICLLQITLILMTQSTTLLSRNETTKSHSETVKQTVLVAPCESLPNYKNCYLIFIKEENYSISKHVTL